jgi:CheY-like chemotaxis protein
MVVRSNILVVDENAPVREALDRVLRLESCDVLSAANGREAIQKAQGLRIDAILLDLDRPDEHRWQTVRHLTAINPLMPVIGMTARGHRNWLAVAADLEALLEKPFDVPSLLRIVKNLPHAAKGAVPANN